MEAFCCTSCSLTVWTSERFARKDEGRSEGLERVITTLAEVSGSLCQPGIYEMEVAGRRTFA